MVPSTGAGLLIALVFVVPGSVYQFVRSRLRGPAPDDASATNRVLRALAASAFLFGAYAAGAGPYLVGLVRDSAAQPTVYDKLLLHGRQLALWAVTLLFLLPAALAGLDYGRSRLGWTLRLTYDPTPRAWDYVFRDAEPNYVRVLTTDGTWLGGWYGSKSFVSSYPEPREIYIETAHRMAPDGSFGDEVPGSRGLYVRCDDVRALELVDGAAAAEQLAEGEGKLVARRLGWLRFAARRG